MSTFVVLAISTGVVVIAVAGAVVLVVLTGPRFIGPPVMRVGGRFWVAAQWGLARRLAE